MYSNIKSCVKVNNQLPDYLASLTGVRQGVNLSPIVFSLFLNDLNTFLSQILQLVSDNINATLSTDDTEVYLRLFMLLYADDTVILAEKASELQNALDAMSEYNCRVQKPILLI